MKFDLADVERVYQAYPRKVAKAGAVKAITKALETIAKREGVKDPVTWLLGRVEAYARTRVGQDPKYTPHPATWFNRGSYDDAEEQTERDFGDGLPPMVPTSIDDAEYLLGLDKNGGKS